jgi:hypothetical protein
VTFGGVLAVRGVVSSIQAIFEQVTEMYLRATTTLRVLIVLVGAIPSLAYAADKVDSSSLDTGYRQMYNLEFGDAHRTFEAWKKTHPEDAMGPVSNAAAYLFAEFERLHVLESELFTDNERFEKRNKLSPDPAVQAAFEGELRRADQIADRTLGTSPNDSSALFAKIMVNGLRSDYAALVEKRNLAALTSAKDARNLAEQLLSRDPSYYDAYLAVGIENYLLGLNPAPVRWLLRLAGAQTDKDEGIAKLRLTAEKGRYLAPYARLLLAVAALRDHNRQQARELLSGLAEEFPQNELYRRELGRITP